MMNTRLFSLRCFFICMVINFPGGAIAARLEVVLDSDPRTHMMCNKTAPNDVITNAATTHSSRADSVGSSLFLYQAGFNIVKNNGSLQKMLLEFSEQSNTVYGTKTVWDANDLLIADDRKIYTSRIAPDGVLTTIPFLWEYLSTQQKAYLNKSALSHVDDQLGQDRLAYVRGARQKEATMPGGVFGSRDSLLGTIVNSAPVFLGAPTAGSPGTDYLSFLFAHSKRKAVIFIGANDGALHAFDADNGHELFAYIPNFLFAKLPALTEVDAPYRPYMDGLITSAEAKVTSQWKTVLVAGLGGGAQGVFALDVSDAEKFDAGAGVLWEFSDADDTDIGNVLAAPLIVKFRFDSEAGNPTSYRYFAVIAGGLNNYRSDDGYKASAHASNSLFLLALDKKKSEPWIAGENYFKIILPSGVGNIANGLTGVTPVLDNAGAVKYLYTTDLQGNLWRIDFKRHAPWSRTPENQIAPVFSAKDDKGNRQAITGAPVILFAPSGYLILFGTGKYMERSDVDKSDFRTQSFYGILDSLDETVKTVSRRQLLQRRLSHSSRADRALKISRTTSSTTNDTALDNPLSNGHKGWYFDFIDSARTGERSISAASVVDGKLFFNTLIPASKPCATSYSRTYSLDAFNGLSLNAALASELTADENFTGELSDGGIWQSSIILEGMPLNNDQPNVTGKRRGARKMIRLRPGGGEIQTLTPTIEVTTVQDIPINQSETVGQLSWHEIINWHELHHSDKRGR